MTGVPGLGRVIDDYDGNPATLRWLSIHPEGRVVEHRSDNRIGWSLTYEMWVQWRLVRDVYREVDPTRYALASGARLIRTTLGVAISVSHEDEPPNPVATGMLGELGIEHEPHGTVAWLAEAHPETGLHGDLDDEQRAALLALAQRHGATQAPAGE